MNETRVIATTTRSDVRAYVARVRVALSDLPDNDADELTQGMEADLAELAAESQSLRSRLGTPETYADDLRAAAGLPPRAPAAQGGALGLRLAHWSERRNTLMAQPWARDLRSVGWAVRGVVVFWVVALVFGISSSNLLGWALGAALSFWVGRATRNWKDGARGLLVTVNLVIALVGLILLPSHYDESIREPEFSGSPAAVEGLAVNGEPVTGIVVYDSSGRRIEQPRAFDQNGIPLLPTTDDETYTPPAFLPPLPQTAPTTPPEAATLPTPSSSTSPPATPSEAPSPRTGAARPSSSVSPSATR